MVELITWPSFFEPIKIGFFWRFFGAQLWGGGAKLVFLKKENGQKRVFLKKKIAPFFWWVLASLHCCCMIVTRCFRRVCQKTL